VGVASSCVFLGRRMMVEDEFWMEAWRSVMLQI